MTKISYAIVAYRSRDTIGKLLASISKQTGHFDHEIIVVDNSSVENCADLIVSGSGAKYILNSSNVGYTKAMNQAIEAATGDYVFLLNPDVELQPDCSSQLLSSLIGGTCVAAAPQLLNHDGTIQHSVRNFPTFATLLYDHLGLAALFPRSRTFGKWRNLYFDHNAVCDVEQPMASALIVVSQELKSLGPMDEQFFIFFSDVDLCKRIADRGGEIRFVPAARAYHAVGGSTHQEGAWLITDSHRGFYRYLVKHELHGWKAILRPVAATLLAMSAAVRITIRKLRGKSF